MANMKSFSNHSSNLNLSQQLDNNLMPSTLTNNNKEQFDSFNQNYYYNPFYQANTDNLVNNTNNNTNECNSNNNNNKKLKVHDDYECKQSIFKLISQQQQQQQQQQQTQQQQQNENTTPTMFLNQDNTSNNSLNKNEQISILKPLREFQLFNQNNLLNNEPFQLNNQIYNNFHQPIPNHHHHHLHNHHHHNRHEFYVDNHLNTNPLNRTIEQSLVKTLEQTTTLISPSTTATPTSSSNLSTPYQDFAFKYEKNENNVHMNGNTNHSYDDDDEDEFDDEFDDETSNAHSSHNSYDYDCDDNYNSDRALGVNSNGNNLAHNNCELKLPGNNNNASILDAYGNSVFDSPLSLSTANEENGTHLTTLTTRQQQDNNFTKYANHKVHPASPLLDAKNNLNSSTSTKSIPSHSNGVLPTVINNLLNVKNEHNDNLKSMTKLGDSTEIPHSLKKSYHGNCNLNDYELITLPLRELNKRLRYVPKMTAIDLKKRRRTLKNRKYAQNCRSKRLEQKCEMELQNIKLKNEISHLKKLIDKFQKEKLMYKAYLEDLFKDPSKLTATVANLKPFYDNTNSNVDTNLLVDHDNNNNNNNNSNNLIDNTNDLRSNNCFMKYD